MKKMNQAMSDITDYGQQTGRITRPSTRIAFQTNLRLERGGGGGRRRGRGGFAVVADEVRNLAQRAAQAAKTPRS
jgi:methyl-accepting chemotaxis protein